MSPKIFFFLIGLITLSSVIEARHLTRKEILHFDVEEFQTLVRNPRDAENLSKAERLAAKWKVDKLSILSAIINIATFSDTNTTLVGTQRIFDNEGQVKEINTIELGVPPEATGKSLFNSIDFDEEDDDIRSLPHNKINNIKQMIHSLSDLGFSVSGTMEQLNKKGEQEVVVYFDEDELFSKDGNFAIYNRTIIASQQEIKDFYKNFNRKFVHEPAIIVYNDKNVLIESEITPHLLGNVIDYYEASDDIITNAPDVIAKISQKYPKAEIPKELASKFNKLYPKYKWRVLVNATNWHITRDVSVTVAYDKFDFNQDTNDTYLVYGIKNIDNKTSNSEENA